MQGNLAHVQIRVQESRYKLTIQVSKPTKMIEANQKTQHLNDQTNCRTFNIKIHIITPHYSYNML